MPKLKTVVEKLDGIEDAYHGLYEEKDGKFILSIEGIDDHPAVVALKNGHTNSKRERDEARRENVELKRKLEALPSDFDPDEWTRLRTEDEARRQDPNNNDLRRQIDAATAAVKAQYETKLAAAKKAHETAIAEKDEMIASLDKDLRRTLVDDGLTKALMKAGVKPTLMKAAKAMFESDVEIVVEDGARQARMKTDLGGDDVERFISNWAQSDDAKDFIPPPSGPGPLGGNSGRIPAGAENPFSKEGWNRTQQGKLLQADRAKAERMAKAAGFKDLDTATKAFGPAN